VRRCRLVHPRNAAVALGFVEVAEAVVDGQAAPIPGQIERGREIRRADLALRIDRDRARDLGEGQRIENVGDQRDIEGPDILLDPEIGRVQAVANIDVPAGRLIGGEVARHLREGRDTPGVAADGAALDQIAELVRSRQIVAVVDDRLGRVGLNRVGDLDVVIIDRERQAANVRGRGDQAQRPGVGRFRLQVRVALDEAAHRFRTVVDEGRRIDAQGRQIRRAVLLPQGGVFPQAQVFDRARIGEGPERLLTSLEQIDDVRCADGAGDRTPQRQGVIEGPAAVDVPGFRAAARRIVRVAIGG
jgi:hypothetical protein